MDSQSVKNTDSAEQKGYDAGKKVSGIKRHISWAALPRTGQPEDSDRWHPRFRPGAGFSPAKGSHPVRSFQNCP